MGDLNSQVNRAVWFDIPCTDLDRAAEFYRAVLGCGVTMDKADQTAFYVIDHDQGNGGCLVEGPTEPTESGGILIYLNVEGRIREATDRVAAHGGKVLQPVHAIGPHGFRSVVVDSEGNRLALHSNSDA